MRHFGNIRHHHLPSDVLSHRKGKLRGKVLKLLALYQLPQGYGHIFLIGHLDSHRRFSGDRRLDTNIRCRQVQLNIIGKPYDLADLHSLVRLHLKPGNGRSLADIRDGYPHAEGLQSLLELSGRLFQLPGGVSSRLARAFGQLTDGRDYVFLRNPLLGPGRCLLQIRFIFCLACAFYR